MIKKLATGLLGILTVATFLAPAEWSNDFFAPFNVARLVVMLGFLGLLLSLIPASDLAASLKKAPRGAQILCVAIPLLVLICVIVQALWPEFAVWLVRDETRGWSYRHAIFIKAACELVATVIFLTLLAKFARTKQILSAVICGVLALLFFVMAGEELSWGQRIFDWATPAAYAKINAQGETNLHNLATQLFQNVLYFGGWLLLVALPFCHDALQKLFAKSKRLKILENFLPPTYFLLIFAGAYGLVDPIWATYGVRASSILFAILGTAAILIGLIVKARGHLADRICLTLGVFLVALFFNLFVSEVWNINSGVPTEYLEIFIGLGILTWAITVRRSFAARRADVRVGQRHH